MGVKITGVLVDALLDTERDFVIRRRVPRVLVDLPSPRCVDGLFTALQDGRFEVRFCGGRALFFLLKNHPSLSISPERAWEAINRELSLQRSGWSSHRLLDHRDSQETQWFFDDKLLDRADRNLEHLFTLLALLLTEGSRPDCLSRAPYGRLSSKEPLSSIWKARRRRLRANSCCRCLRPDAEIQSRAVANGRALENLLATTGE
jgi:hypothetical protein